MKKKRTGNIATQLPVDEAPLKTAIEELNAKLAEQERHAAQFRTEAQETVDTLNYRILSLERQNVALRDSLTVTEGALLQLRAKQ